MNPEDTNLRRTILGHCLGVMDEYFLADGMSHYQRGYFQAWALVGQIAQVNGLLTQEQRARLEAMRIETENDPTRPRPDLLPEWISGRVGYSRKEGDK